MKFDICGKQTSKEPGLEIILNELRPVTRIFTFYLKFHDVCGKG